MSSDKSTDKTYQLFQKVQKASRPSYKYLYWNITRGKKGFRAMPSWQDYPDRFYVSHHLMNNDRAAEIGKSLEIKKILFSADFSKSLGHQSYFFSNIMSAA